MHIRVGIERTQILTICSSPAQPSLSQTLLWLLPIPYLVTSHPSSMAALNLSHKHAAKSKSREGVKTNMMSLPNKLDRRWYLEQEVRMRLVAHPLGFGATTIHALAVPKRLQKPKTTTHDDDGSSEDDTRPKWLPMEKSTSTGRSEGYRWRDWWVPRAAIRI